MQLPSSEKNYMATLVNVVVNGSDAKMVDAKMVEKVGVATIAANKATWPATIQGIYRHPEDESVGNHSQTRREEFRAETVRDAFDPTPKAEKGPQRPRRHFRRPGGGRPQEEPNTTISTNKPEKNSTPRGVNVEGTEPEHASLFTVRGRICACRDDTFDSSVEFLVDCGATSDFMSMQTAKRARLPLYKLRNPRHFLTAGGVQVEVSRYYTRAYVRVGELVFRRHLRSWKFCRMWYLDYHGFEATIELSTGRSGTQTFNMVQICTGCLLANQDIPPSYSFKPLRSWTFFRYFHPVARKRVRLEILPHCKTHYKTQFCISRA